MIASALIIVFCAALLVVWLRATAILLIRNLAVGRKSQLQVAFASVREQALAGNELGPLHDALDRDGRVLMYLLKHASTAWEDRLLIWDYRLMRSWFALSRVALPAQARTAIAEMTEVLSALENRLGTRAGSY